jgi:hypothetical protein
MLGNHKNDLLALILFVTAQSVQTYLTILFYILSCVSLLISIKNKIKNKKND